MPNITRHIISPEVPFEEISVSNAGGKGYNLFRLRRFGFAVPEWIVVSCAVFNDVLTTKREAIEDLISGIDVAHRDAAENASSAIQKLIADDPFPADVAEELGLVLKRHGTADDLYSIRSSVADEDSAQHSFAGQMDSFLNVRRPDIETTVQKVWMSVFSARALLYRKQKSLSITDVSAAVIIQRMIHSASSGVVFSRNPETAGQECIVVAGFGLGEGIVTDAVETDTYRIGWQSDKIQKEVRRKESAITLDATRGQGTCVQAVSPERQRAPVLSDEQIRRLRDIVTKAEQCFGLPQDVEWAISESGELFILQARPIVFSRVDSGKGQIRIWDNSNIVESYPGTTLPLTFSFIRGAYTSAFRNAAQEFVPFRKSLEQSEHVFENMIGLLDGRVYYNLLNWYEMLSYLPGFRRHKESWDLMIGISKQIPFPQGKLSPLGSFLAIVRTIWKLMSVRGNARRFFRHFQPTYRQFNSVDLSTLSVDELIAIYRSLERNFLDRWHLTLVNDFSAMKYYDWLKQLCSRWGLTEYANLHNNLLCGESGVESVAPVRSLVRLAQLVRSNEEYRLLMSEESNSVWRTIQCEPRYQVLKDALNTHLEAFGDRGLEELKLEKPTFRDDPPQLIELVRSYVQLDLSVETMESQEQSIRREAEAVVARVLKNPFRWLVFRFVLSNARLAVANRENMRFARSRAYGIARRLFRRMGNLLAKKGLIDTTDDIYYLTLDEVFGILEGTATSQNLKAIIVIRKLEYEEFAKRTLSERIETADIPYLNSFTPQEQVNATDNVLRGIGCSSGIARGNAKVVLDPRSPIEPDHQILVAKSTDPGWVFLMISSQGIVVEKGSVLSHTAIIGRELGIPTIVGVKDATKLIRDGDSLLINGSTGVVQCQ